MAFLTVLAFAALIWWAVIWAICLLGWRVAKTRYGNVQPSSYEPGRLSVPEDQVPGVTILRPLRGLDCNLYENLESTFVQKYPGNRFEIICSVAEEDDQAIPIVKSLMERYPSVDASIIVGEEVVGVNPKINNLIRPYRAAKYNILWIVDSNVQVSPGALGRAVAAFDPSPSPSKPIGLVHHVPFPAFPDINLGSRVEQAFLSTTHAKMYLALNSANIDSCVCGKSSFFKKSDLERSTRNHENKNKNRSSVKAAISQLSESDRYGIAAFNEYLGEDNMIGVFIWHDGNMRHAVAPDVAANAVGNMGFEKYFWRRVRWIRVRKYMVTSSTLLEPLTESILSGLVGSFAFKRFLSIPRVLFLFLHILAWYSIDVSVFRALSRVSPVQPLHNPWHDGPGVSGLRPAFITAWLVRELCAFPIWLFAMLGNRVSWREDGKVYRVRRDGRVEVSDPEEESDWIDRSATQVFTRIRGRGASRFQRLPLGDEEES